MIRINTLGFTRKSAEVFFSLLTAHGVQRVVDIRLNASSQLAGFAKRQDLPFFLKAVAGITYVAEPRLAPTPEILADFKSGRIDWAGYESRFLQLMVERRVESVLSPATLHDSCLLCSEDVPAMCHRRLVAEYLQRAWGDVDIVHLH